MVAQRRNEIGYSNLFRSLDAISDTDGILELIEGVIGVFGLRSFAYLGSRITGVPNEEPYLVVSYSSDWVQHYKVQRFANIDPTIQIGMRRLLPIDWDSFDQTNAKVSRLFGESREFGVGLHGITIPVHGPYGDRAIVSFTSDLSKRDWQSLRRGHIRDFQVLALHLHQTIRRLAGRSGKEHARLSPRERECLLWIAEGKTYWETAVILGLSEHTVRCYLESARHKLGAANNTHAVNKAGKANLLTSLP